MPHRVVVAVAFLIAGCAAATAERRSPAVAASQVQDMPADMGVILAPGGGSQLFCDTPHLDVTVKVGNAQNSTSMEMGTARLAAGTENFGRHRVDEIIYFVRGRGFATVGDERQRRSLGAACSYREACGTALRTPVQT